MLFVRVGARYVTLGRPRCTLICCAWPPLCPPVASTAQQQSRGRFIGKAACAAASLTGLVVAAPLLLGGKEAVPPAHAEETRRSAAAVAPALAAEDVASKYEYVKFDVQLSEGESGSFIVEVRPDWAPLGAARFTTLSKAGFFQDCRFFRVIDGFIAQVYL